MIPFRFPIVCLLWLVLLGATTGRAALSWAQKTVEATGSTASPVLEAHFRFTNTGDGPVEIRNVESSCGCTTTALEKRLYQPKESGEIVAKYTPGTHTGTQKKTLLVITGDGQPDTTLTLVAHIPEILRITPDVVTWAHDEQPRPKTMTLELLQGPSADAVTVESSSPETRADLSALTKGRRYELSVRPARTDKFSMTKLTIRCRYGSEEKTFTAYATVKPDTGER